MELLSELEEPVFEPEDENTLSVDGVIEIGQVMRVMMGSAKESMPESEPRIVSEVVGSQQVITEAERAGDNSWQRVVRKPVLLFTEPEEFITEPKRMDPPTQVAKSHGETDTVIIIESSSESEDGSSQEVQPLLSKVPYVLVQ
jgi:hypothetical protein